MAEEKKVFEELSSILKKELGAGQNNCLTEDMKYAQKVKKPLTAQIAITNYKNWIKGKNGTL